MNNLDLRIMSYPMLSHVLWRAMNDPEQIWDQADCLELVNTQLTRFVESYLS